jgi:hypothetical protein
MNPRFDGIFARSPRIVGRKIADEFILVPIVGRGADVDAIFTLNHVGAFIWDHLDGRSTGEAIVSAVVEGFDVDRSQAESDYEDFLDQLLHIRAVAAVDPG